MQYTAAIIGLGQIGQGYDYDLKDAVLTHANAYQNHKGFQLVAGVDPDPKARKNFEKKYKVPAFSTVEEMYTKCNPEVVSIATPTALHLSTVKEVTKHKPKFILCEKPFAPTLEESQEIVELSKKSGTTLGINFMRRFEPGVQTLKKELVAGTVGDIYKGTVWYCKGLLNNGSHFIDLLQYLLGPVGDIAVLNPGRTLSNDIEPDLRIRFVKADIYFLATQEEKFLMRDITLIGTKGVVNYWKGGEEIQIHPIESIPLFPNSKTYASKGRVVPSDFGHFQSHVVEAIYKTLHSSAPLPSGATNGLEVAAILERVRALVDHF